MMLKRIAAAFMFAVLMLTAASCNAGKGPVARDDGSLKKVIDAGELILGLDDQFPPLGFTDENGEIVGFDIDVAEEVCRRLGVRLVKQTIDWDEKEDDLNSKRIDCIWNGFSYTAARDEAMTLSEPYMLNELIIIIPSDSKVMLLNDLKGKKIGVQSGSTAQETLEASEIYPEISEAAFDTVETLIDRLNKKEIDAVLVDSVAAYYYIFSSEKQYYILSESLAEEEYVIGFRKEDRTLCDKIQEIIGEMKSDGTLGDISTKWFGSDITTVR